MRRRVQPWGNSLGLRIPKSIADDTGLMPGSEVEIEVKDGRVVVTPVSPPSYRLEELLDAITPENLHTEFDLGEAVGNEVM